MKSVAVIGGGISGLTAAFDLTRRGIPVTLYEKSGRTGGAIRSELNNGFLSENGPSQITETPEVAALVDDLQLQSRRLYANPDAKARFIVKGGRLTQVPSSPLGLVSTKLFSLAGKLRVLAEPFIRRGDASQEESVAEFVRRRLGIEVLEYAVDPLISGIYAGDPARLSLRCAFPKLYALEQAGGSLTSGALASLFNGKTEKKKRGRVLFSFDSGCQVLPDALATRLGSAIRLSAAVTGISQTPAGWEVHLEHESCEHAAVVLTAPAYELGALATGSKSFHVLKEINYPPVARVTLGFREDQFPRPIQGFGFLVPGKENFHILGTVFASCVYPGRAPQGCVNLSSYLGGLRNPRITELSPAEILAATVNDYRALLGVTGEPIFASQTVIRKAIPQYTLGYGKFRQWMADTERSLPGLFFAGNYTNGISVADSIGSGLSAAERTAGSLHA